MDSQTLRSTLRHRNTQSSVSTYRRFGCRTNHRKIDRIVVSFRHSDSQISKARSLLSETNQRQQPLQFDTRNPTLSSRCHDRQFNEHNNTDINIARSIDTACNNSPLPSNPILLGFRVLITIPPQINPAKNAGAHHMNHDPGS